VEPFDFTRDLVASAGDTPRFRSDPVPREVLDELVEAATRRYAERFAEPPWRFVVVAGEERERLIGKIAEALGRHWGLGAVRPRGLASEAVLRAPALVLVFSRVPASEGLDAINQVAFATQNIVLLAAARGLATHRTFGSNLVPEAVLDFVGGFLGQEIRSGEFVTMLALGYPEEPAPGVAAGTPPDWIGEGPTTSRPPAPPLAPAAPPAAVLRSPGGERVLVVDPYRWNREQIGGLLVAAGYSVETFEEGRALLLRLDAGPRCHMFVVSDNLPDTSGFELVRSLRGRHVEATPLICTTARRDSAFRIGGLAAGVDYYLRKPVNAIELYTAARILLDRQRRAEELAAAQARLVQQAKMASLGQLVAGVAHEINTPLGAVVSNNDLFLRCFARLRVRATELGLDADPIVRRDLQAVEELSEVTRTACERITDIVRELRTFARLDEADRKAVDLHEGIESTLLLINHILKGRIDVRRDYGTLPAVECHPNQLNQVFMNLLVNAAQAISGEGRITVRTRHDAAAGRVTVAVSDSGHGIKPDHLSRIFDPGFTTKGAGVGTGLGLSICYQIVEAHGGEITVASEAGKGTTFTVALPVAAEVAA
jgi:signal transduction histidine kinase/nitroreductase